MLGHGMAVDVVDHGAQQGVAGQHEQGGNAGLGSRLAPAQAPTAAEPHSVAAVFSP
jgi:hypothetical protein